MTNPPSVLRHLIKFSLLLSACGATAFFLHIYAYSLIDPEGTREIINFSYKFNFGITFLFTTTLIIASKHLKEQLGFIFLGSSFVKLAIFLFIAKTSDLVLEKSSFLHFFIPYSICVVLEIIYVSRILKGSNFNQPK